MMYLSALQTDRETHFCVNLFAEKTLFCTSSFTEISIYIALFKLAQAQLMFNALCDQWQNIK